MKCPLCRKESDIAVSAEIMALENQIRYGICDCGGCGLGFSDPMTPAPAEHYEGFEWYGYRWEFGEALKELRARGVHTLLEIGCGQGHFLSMAGNAGFETLGIDFNDSAVSAARRQFGLQNVSAQTLEDFLGDHPGTMVDAVCFFHVMEHLSDPERFITEILKVLNTSGTVLFSVPSPERIDLRFFEREEWDYPPHHLTRWNLKSLHILLERCGLKIAGFRYEPLTLTKILFACAYFLKSKVMRRVRPYHRLISGDGSGAGKSALAVADCLAAARAMLTGSMKSVSGQSLMLVCERK